MADIALDQTSMVYVDPDNERVYHIRRCEDIRGKDVMRVPRSENRKEQRRGCKRCEALVKGVNHD